MTVYLLGVSLLPHIWHELPLILQNLLLLWWLLLLLLLLLEEKLTSLTRTETTMQGKERADKDNCREEINVEM